MKIEYATLEDEDRIKKNDEFRYTMPFSSVSQSCDEALDFERTQWQKAPSYWINKKVRTFKRGSRMPTEWRRKI